MHKCKCITPCIIKYIDDIIKKSSDSFDENKIHVLLDEYRKKILTKPKVPEYLQMQSRKNDSAVIQVEDGIPFDTTVVDGAGYTIQYDKTSKHFILQPGTYLIDWAVALHDEADISINIIVNGWQHIALPIKNAKIITGHDILNVCEGAIISLDVTNAQGQGARLTAGDVQANIRFVKIG